MWGPAQHLCRLQTRPLTQFAAGPGGLSLPSDHNLGMCMFWIVMERARERGWDAQQGGRRAARGAAGSAGWDSTHERSLRQSEGNSGSPLFSTALQPLPPPTLLSCQSLCLRGRESPFQSTGP